MKKRMLAALLALCMVLSMGAGAFAAEGEEGYIPFLTESGDDYFHAEEPTTVTMTATVPQDGTYVVITMPMGPSGDEENFSISSENEALAFLADEEPSEVIKGGYWSVELPAGEYTLHVENAAECSVKMELAHPLDAVDGVIGEGLYVCQLDQAATVNYTVIGLGSVVAFYTGAEQALSKAEEVRLIDENSKQQPVTFEPGAAVIDFEGGHVTSALVGDGAESPAEGASESAVPEAVLDYYGLSAEEFAALKAAITAQIQEEWTADEAYDSNLMGLYDWTYTTDFIIRVHSDETSDSILGENIGKNLMTDESMDRCIEELAQYCTGDDALFQQRAMVLGHGINRWAADNGVSYERWCMVWEGVMTALSTYVSGSILTDGNPTDEYIRPLLSQDN